MSFSLLGISSMYPRYIESFHKKHPPDDGFTYDNYFDLLLNDTTEFAGSYYKNFRKLGIDAKYIISNESLLQNTWRSEKKIKSANPLDTISAQIKTFNPEVLWIEDLNCFTLSWLSQIKKEVRSIRLIIAYHCAPYGQSVLEKLGAADFVITCTPGIKTDLEKKGIKAYHVYHGFDKDSLSKLNDNSNVPGKKLVFSGSLFPGGNYHNERIDFIERLLKERLELSLYVNLEKSYRIRIKQSIYFLATLLKSLKMKKLIEKTSVSEYTISPVKNYSDFLIKSNHKPVFGIDMYNLFNVSDMVLNMHVGIAGDYAGNMRLFEVTGVGSCLLTDNKKNLGELFDIDNEIVVYNSVEDCIEKIKWLTEHESERRKIATCGHQKTLQYHTVENRCRKIIDIISEELKKS